MQTKELAALLKLIDFNGYAAGTTKMYLYYIFLNPTSACTKYFHKKYVYKKISIQDNTSHIIYFDRSHEIIQYLECHKMIIFKSFEYTDSKTLTPCAIHEKVASFIKH
ncbi:hypothetical protein [Alkalibacter mobilis]|uniref:hypothetical protein n=1 Tax=Alkalibacter mobilis TaxID=2787712 RepID=UPI00189F6E88|nr:hypothetical protein [Alkalibacter mobilis]MBF7096258.1 hypothetical protein [Alkalibacter mobilis]